MMATVDDLTLLENIQDLRTLITGCDGKLIKSRISPDDYFTNLSYGPPTLKYPDVGISKLVVSTCEMVSNLLLEDIGDSKSVSRTIVMIFEYYFLVGPVLFKSQGARFVNDVTFMEHFMRYIQSLCASRAQVQKELGNIIASLKLYNPIRDID